MRQFHATSAERFYVILLTASRIACSHYTSQHLIFFTVANIDSFLSIKLVRRIEDNIFLPGGLAIYSIGDGCTGAANFLDEYFFSFHTVIEMIGMSAPFKSPMMGYVYRAFSSIMQWSLASVIMLAVLTAIDKLQDLATVILGISLYTLVVFLVVYVATSVIMLERKEHTTHFLLSGSNKYIIPQN